MTSMQRVPLCLNVALLSSVAAVGCIANEGYAPSTVKANSDRLNAFNAAARTSQAALAQLANEIGLLHRWASPISFRNPALGTIDQQRDLDLAIAAAARARTDALKTVANDIDRPLEALLRKRIRVLFGRVDLKYTPCSHFDEGEAEGDGDFRRPILRLLALQNPHTFPISRGLNDTPPRIESRLAVRDENGRDTDRQIPVEVWWSKQKKNVRIKLSRRTTNATFIVRRVEGEELVHRCLIMDPNSTYKIAFDEAQSSWLIRQRTRHDDDLPNVASEET